MRLAITYEPLFITCALAIGGAIGIAAAIAIGIGVAIGIRDTRGHCFHKFLYLKYSFPFVQKKHLFDLKTICHYTCSNLY